MFFFPADSKLFLFFSKAAERYGSGDTHSVHRRQFSAFVGWSARQCATRPRKSWIMFPCPIPMVFNPFEPQSRFGNKLTLIPSHLSPKPDYGSKTVTLTFICPHLARVVLRVFRRHHSFGKCAQTTGRNKQINAFFFLSSDAHRRAKWGDPENHHPWSPGGPSTERA